jgi:hypothetical protein
VGEIHKIGIAGVLVALLAGTALAGTITGTVTAGDTRQPLASMVVAAYDPSGTLRGTATTDSAGLYVLTLPAGSYRVLAYDNSGVYATVFDGGAESFETTRVTTLGATQTVHIDFALPPGGDVTGIVSSPSGAAVANGVVEVYNLSGTRRAFTTTNASGGYSVVLPPGEYKVVAYDTSGTFAASFYRDATDFAAATAVRVTARQTTSAIDFRLGVAARVVGSVIDAATQLPLPGMPVFAYSEAGVFVASTVTDASGVFRFSLPAGRYRFVAADPAHVYATGYFAGKRSFAAADVLELIAGRTLPGVQLALVRAGIAAGRVTDANGVALAGITVAAYNLDGTLQAATTSGANGAYELAIAPGEVKLAAFDPALTYAADFFSKRGSFAQADVVTIAGGQRVTGYDFILFRAGRFSGTVTDAVTLQPLAGVHVAAYDANGFLVAEAVTSANGAYAIAVRPGAYRLLAFDDQLRYVTRYAGGSRTFEGTVPRNVDAGATAALNFGLLRGVKVTGTVTDSAGRPLSGIEVAVLDAVGEHVAIAVSSGGTFGVVLPADSYRFVAHDPEGRLLDVTKNVVVAEGQFPTVSFVLTGAGKRRAAKH